MMLNSDMILSMDSYLLGMELRLFWAASAFYALGLLLFIFHIVTRMNIFGKAALASLVVGVLAHTGLMSLRGFETGRVPAHTLYETLSWFALSLTAAYLYSSRKWKGVYIPGVLVSTVSTGACLYALFAASPAIEPLSPVLRSRWFELRQLFLYFSYAVFAVSASVEAACLIIGPFVRKDRAPCYGLTVENIKGFHASAFSLSLFGYPFLSFAIFSGAVWANSAFGRYWGWDPWETWTLITWTVFTVYLHAKSVPSLTGRAASVFNIIGFVSILSTTFLGPNWLAALLGAYVPGGGVL